jgi:hypothetical protein
MTGLRIGTESRFRKEASGKRIYSASPDVDLTFGPDYGGIKPWP